MVNFIYPTLIVKMDGISKLTLKRLKGDFKLLKKDPHEYFEAYPDDTNVLVWYFIVKGPDFSDFTGGYYVGKIMHNPEYPLKAPDFMVLTPNGRFIEDKKICLSNSSYHSNEWSAVWNIKTILTGFLSIMLDDNENGISHIHMPKDQRQVMAKQSIEYNKQRYPEIIKKFTRFLDESGNPRVDAKPAINKPVEAKDESTKDDDKDSPIVKSKSKSKPKTKEIETDNKVNEPVVVVPEPVVVPKEAATAVAPEPAKPKSKPTAKATKIAAKPKAKPKPKTKTEKLIEELGETLE